MTMTNLSEVFLPTVGGTVRGDVEINGAIVVNDGSGEGSTYDVADEITGLKASLNFSTSETNTGQTWINGKTIYRRVFEFGSVGVSGSISSATIDTGLTNITVVRIDCIGYDESGRMIPVPFASTSGEEYIRDVFMQADGKILVRCNTDCNLKGGGHVILEYVK